MRQFLLGEIRAPVDAVHDLQRPGLAVGNFPQAFTHPALISAAFNLDRELERRERT